MTRSTERSGLALAAGSTGATSSNSPPPTAPPMGGTGAHELVADGESAPGQRPGDHRARPASGEGPVAPQSRAVGVRRQGGRGEEAVEGGPQVVDPEAGGRVDFDHLGV